MRFLIKCKKLVYFLVFVVYVSCSFSPKTEMFVHEEVEWNYLIYMAADNNLERFAINNIKALQSIGTNEDVNILVLLDRSPSYDRSEGNWSGTKLMLISNNPKAMNDDVICDYIELDMTDETNLYNFLKTANMYFPSRHTVLNIWSHGRGVYPDGIISKGVIEDYTTGYGAANTMSIVDLAASIAKYENESNKKIDIVQFDACDMQMIEGTYQLKDLTDYIIGAESEISATGSDYKGIAEYLKSQKNFSAEDLSKYISDSFYEYQKESLIDFSYCVVKTDRLDSLIVKLNLLLENILNLDDENLNSIIIKRKNMLQVDKAYPEFCDLYEFLNDLQLIDIDTSSVIQELLECVIYTETVGEFVGKSKGLGINIPYNKEQFGYYIKPDSDYALLDFYKESSFDEFLLRLSDIVNE